MPVHSPFEHWVRRTPDAIALTHDDEELTYAELNRLANRIAHQLIALRSGPEALVAIVGERAPEFVAAILGTLKAGCAYLPLETDIPPRRLEELLDDARPEVVLLVRGGSLDAGRAPHVLRVDGALDGDDLPDPGLEISPRSLAYVLYTSGSTGRPKGVCVEHGSVSNLVDDFTRRLEITSSDRILHFGRLGFDVTVWELFVAFAAGAAVCGGAISTLHSPAALTQLMRARRVTVVCVVPALLGVLDPEDFPDVRMVVSVAEPFAGELVDRWGPGRRFFNGYGPTETTVLATTMECRPGSPGRPPIGKPGAGVRALLLDASLRPVPPGERGELCLGGVCVGRGYLGAPRLTADRFVPDPTGNGGRLYRTGDVVRENADGDLEFLGRIDDQLKVRGVRIEPVEVEAALGQVPAIRESAVTAQKLGGSAQLVAFVVLAESATLSDADLRAAAEELLPRPFVPQAFVRVEALPRSPNGKIDRKALPEALPLGGRGRSAETRLERELVRAWKEVLEVDDVSAEDSFLALGGDSVRAMQVAARLWR
ncbi:MAG TPA: non-ribosomal peptide synthetase, partial [Gaiellaceae bacterium]